MGQLEKTQGACFHRPRRELIPLRSLRAIFLAPGDWVRAKEGGAGKQELGYRWGRHLPRGLPRSPAQPPPALGAQRAPGGRNARGLQAGVIAAPRLARYRTQPASAPLGTLPAEPPPLASPGTAARARARAVAQACPPTAPARSRSRAPAGARTAARSCARSALPPPAAAGSSSASGGRRGAGDRAQRPLAPGPAAVSHPPRCSAAPPSARLGRLPASRPGSRGSSCWVGTAVRYGRLASLRSR
ncbi:hypothetical protein NN561_019740 [Cricetulus griseus]